MSHLAGRFRQWGVAANGKEIAMEARFNYYGNQFG